MAPSWGDLVGTSHYQEGPCVCPAHPLPPPVGLESTESTPSRKTQQAAPGDPPASLTRGTPSGRGAALEPRPSLGGLESIYPEGQIAAGIGRRYAISDLPASR